ncbi:hypothetical protein [Sporosarcina sp. YIM B06819]|uniref:hypothetical protein n=1 Tax=Sporosarcina sp. YIM B06819 TaxID=3081769 RepID=UPI00298BDC61|nr:hypothetical protein [Sporosarcina sp. YIM B06819]
MNAVMTFATASDQLQRYDAIRRKNAESAYDRTVQYNGQNQKILEKLEALLTGKDEPQVVQPGSKELQKLGAGQMEQVVLPIGKTLEETIGLWQDVRTDAVSVPEPTTADHQLVATASAKIAQMETQIALQKLEQSEFETTMARQAAETGKVKSFELPAGVDRETFIMQKRFEQAISTYAFQAEARKNGYELNKSKFSAVA